MRRTFIIACLAFTACGAPCPSPAPSFERDVAPRMKEICGKCHAERARGANRQGAPRDAIYDSAEQVQAALADILARAQRDMPPATSGLPRLDVSVVQSWAECGAAP